MIHLIGERGSRKVGAPLNHVPYKGVPPVVQDLLGKQIDLTFVPLGGSTADLVESGKVRVFGSSGATPSTRLPKVPAPSTLDPALATSCTPVGPPCSCRARRRRPLRYGCSALTQPAVRMHCGGWSMSPTPIGGYFIRLVSVDLHLRRCPLGARASAEHRQEGHEARTRACRFHDIAFGMALRASREFSRFTKYGEARSGRRP